MKRIKDNEPLMYKDNEQIEDMIFEKVSSLNMNDFDDRYYFHKVSSEIGLNTQALDKSMSELGYSFVRETQPMGYDLCRIYQKDNIQTYVFLNLISGVDERGKNLKNIYRLVCANTYYKNGVSDSKKIKDASDTPLNGLLSIAFNDGTEDEMCKTVQQHANESGEINGIQYETYETDEQDGVAFVDLCAVGVSDATEFVKALLEKWGVLENTADIDFDTQTEEEYNEEVADSQKVGDMVKPVHLRGYAEKMRAKRRNKNADDEPTDEPNTDEEKSNVSDSRIKDNVNNTILRFHIGRGGRFYNQGNMTYEGVYNDGLTSFAYEHDALDDDGYLIDEAGNYIGAKNGDIVGVLDWDGDYDTDIFVYLTDVEFDDRYYGAIVGASYVEPEVAEYVSGIIINDIVENYTLNDLPTVNDDNYEDELDYHLDGFCHDYGVDNTDIKNIIRNYLDGVANK